jgi:hypothetical protein
MPSVVIEFSSVIERCPVILRSLSTSKVKEREVLPSRLGVIWVMVYLHPDPLLTLGQDWGEGLMDRMSPAIAVSAMYLVASIGESRTPVCLP